MTAFLRKALVAATLAALTTSCMRWQPVRTDVAPNRDLGKVRVQLILGSSVYLAKAAISGDSIVGAIAGGGYSRRDREAGNARIAIPLTEVRRVQSGQVRWIPTILLTGSILVALGLFVPFLLASEDWLNLF